MPNLMAQLATIFFLMFMCYFISIVYTLCRFYEDEHKRNKNRKRKIGRRRGDD